MVSVSDKLSPEFPVIHGRTGRTGYHHTICGQCLHFPPYPQHLAHHGVQAHPHNHLLSQIQWRKVDVYRPHQLWSGHPLRFLHLRHDHLLQHWLMIWVIIVSSEWGTDDASYSPPLPPSCPAYFESAWTQSVAEIIVSNRRINFASCWVAVNAIHSHLSISACMARFTPSTHRRDLEVLSSWDFRPFWWFLSRRKAGSVHSDALLGDGWLGELNCQETSWSTRRCLQGMKTWPSISRLVALEV